MPDNKSRNLRAVPAELASRAKSAAALQGVEDYWREVEESEMRNIRVILALLVLGIGVWFGWSRYSTRKRLEQEQRELFEGYERCVAPLNEAYGRSATHTQEETAIDQKARAVCRDRWFGYVRY